MMAVLRHYHHLQSRLILQDTHLNPSQSFLLGAMVLSLYKVNFTNDRFTALCDKHWMTVSIAKYTKQHLFPFAPVPLMRVKNSGERLKRMKYNMLQKFLPLSRVSFFLLPQSIL
jgi:hypothetical protein